MTIKRYIAEKDSTITNAYRQTKSIRAIDSNMGASDILEVFSIYGQVDDTSLEKSRLLLQFPVSDIISDRNSKIIPENTKCQFILKLSNASTSESTIENSTFSIFAVSGTWQEGFGLDMEDYSDIGVVNWVSASSDRAWNTPGGDFFSSSIDAFIIESTDDLEVDITSLVEEWIAGTKPNNGILVALSSSLENSTNSFYTKKFFARRSQFFYKKPYIELRANSSIKDNRKSFYLKNSLTSNEDSTNTIFLYNSVRGQLRNIPSVGTGSLLVSLYTGTINSGPVGLPLALQNGSTTQVTGGFYATGIYTASLSVSGNYNLLYDIWKDMSGNELYTGSIEPIIYDAEDSLDNPEYVLSMPQLQQSYNSSEIVNFRIEVKNKQWDSNIYHVAAYEPDNTIIENLFYKVTRIADGFEVIPYGIGSFKHTLTSYDKNGNYFELDMSLLEPGFSYRLNYGFEFNGQFRELKQIFKFRVDK
jgi:hypothetical protein